MASTTGSGRQFVIKVPGKVILTGEHAVVYGKLALAASIDLSTRIDLKLEPSAQDRLNIHFNDFNFNFQVPLEDLSQESVVSMENLKIILKNHLLEQNPAVERSILAICYLFCNLTASPIDGVSFDVKLSVKSDIPIGAGLGSSAAFSVASSAAVHVIRHFKSGGGEFCADCDAINRWAFELEKMFHATPSGVDNSVCTRGGIVRFQSGRIEPLETSTFQAPKILLVNTKVPRETRILVQSVRDRWNRHRQVVEAILDAINGISLQMAQLPADFNTIRELLTMNQWLLASLGVSHDSLEEIHKLATTRGQACKLTGAGGGGLALIWIDPDAKNEVIELLEAELNAKGYSCWTTRLGVPGLEIAVC